MTTMLAVMSWVLLGPFVFAALHRIESFGGWFGWLCLVLCGPLTWWLIFLLWIAHLPNKAGRA